MHQCTVRRCTTCAACCTVPPVPQYGMLLIVFLVALAFSVVSPVLLALAVLFFCLSWLFWRYSLLYVYVGHRMCC